MMYVPVVMCRYHIFSAQMEVQMVKPRALTTARTSSTRNIRMTYQFNTASHFYQAQSSNIST